MELLLAPCFSIMTVAFADMETIASTDAPSSTSAKRPSNRIVAYRLAVQVGLFAWAVVTAAWGSVTLVAIPVAVLGVFCVVQSFNARLIKFAQWGGWITTLAIMMRLFVTKDSYSIDPYYIEFAAIVATGRLLTWLGHPTVHMNQSWRWLTVLWFAIAAVIGLGYGYYYNFAGPFFAALASAFLLLIAIKKLLRVPGWGHQAINTLLLLIIVIPVVDLITRPKYHLDIDTALRERYYSPEKAKSDPVAFKQWWYPYMSQWNQMGGSLYMKDPAGA